MFGPLNLTKGLDAFQSLQTINAIEVKLNIVFFMLDLDLGDSSDPLDRTRQLAMVHDIAYIIRINEIEGVQIKNLYTISPSSLNNTEDWVQEKVTEILLGTSTNQETAKNKYHKLLLQAGGSYVLDALNLPVHESEQANLTFETILSVASNE